MAIIINNTATVKSDAEELRSESIKIESVKNSIEYVLAELNQYWNEVQEDQQVFYKGLQADQEALETIKACNDEFSDSLIEYMEVTDKTSSQTVSL